MAKPGKVIPRYFSTSPLDWMAIEIRENRGGRGVGGFFLRGGYTLKEALESDDLRVRKLAELQLNKLRQVVRAYLREGLLSINDLTAEEKGEDG